MKYLYIEKTPLILFLLLMSSISHGVENKQALNMSCADFSWSDVESLVQPYLDDTLHTALVMQGQSSNYKTSEAAIQAMDESLPEVVKTILRSLIKANC